MEPARPRSFGGESHAVLWMLAAASLTLVAPRGATANVFVYVLLNPTSTAGAGATSTRSGAGTFHIYAADVSDVSYGISSYSLTMGPAVTASQNRAPVTTIQDGGGESYSAGFNLLRSSSNAAVMAGAQNLPDQTPFSIKGIGQSAGSFATVVAPLPNYVVAGPTTSGAWGGEYAPLPPALATWGGRQWVFLGEGTYLGFADVPSIVSAAAFTTYGSANNFSSVAAQTEFVGEIVYPPPPPPEPTTLTLLAIGLASALGFTRRR